MTDRARDELREIVEHVLAEYMRGAVYTQPDTVLRLERRYEARDRLLALLEAGAALQRYVTEATTGMDGDPHTEAYWLGALNMLQLRHALAAWDSALKAAKEGK